jgi:DNA repair protein RecN (Recombination protein N)
MVTTNPGQPIQPLGKVASGGELSRISLAIVVISARKISTPTLIFDEVDVGISGPTAAVGRLLRQLGESTQVMVVTHLPQVAGKGHQHMVVSKHTDGKTTETQMQALTPGARLNELARLLGAIRSPITPWPTPVSCSQADHGTGCPPVHVGLSD